MKERNDPAAVSEGLSEDSTETAEETAVEEPKTDLASEDTVRLDPLFDIRKRQEDGSWKAQSVEITEASAEEAEPDKNDGPTEPTEPLSVAEAEKNPVWKKLRAKTIGNVRIVVGAVAAAAILVVAGLSIYTYQYPNVFRGVKLASEYSLSGMTQGQAAQYIEADCQDEILNHDITVSGNNAEFTLHVADAAEQVDGAATAQAAYRVGREGGYFQRLGDVVGALFGQRNVPATIVVKEKKIKEFVTDVHSQVQYDPVQPSFTVNKEKAIMTIDTGTPGLDFKLRPVMDALEEQISRMDFEPYTIETFAVAQDRPDPEQMAKEASTEAESARVDTKTGAILRSVQGVEVTADEIAAAIGDASKQTYTLPVTITKATVSAKKLKEVLFRDVLAQTTTYYSSSQIDRTTNVRLTAEACDGTILNPGDEFSYNDVVGERTPERGYQTATIFVDGASIDDYGGGACQSSSTIYMAVLRADLEVTERRNHQFQISYTPIAQDATVAWGSQDFKFVNNTEYPIKISMDMGNGSLTCTIYGTKTDDKTVELSSTSYVSGAYREATLYKTVTVNGESTTTVANESSYRLGDGH